MAGHSCHVLHYFVDMHWSLNIQQLACNKKFVYLIN